MKNINKTISVILVIAATVSSDFINFPLCLWYNVPSALNILAASLFILSWLNLAFMFGRIGKCKTFLKFAAAIFISQSALTALTYLFLGSLVSTFASILPFITFLIPLCGIFLLFSQVSYEILAVASINILMAAVFAVAILAAKKSKSKN